MSGFQAVGQTDTSAAHIDQLLFSYTLQLLRSSLCGELVDHCVRAGASGHETDKISPSSPPGTQLLAKGTNPLKKWTPLEEEPVSGQNQGFVRLI